MDVQMIEWIDYEPIVRDNTVCRLKRFCLLILVALFVHLWLHTDAAAVETTFRCGGGLVSVGDSSAKVFEKCGEPTKESKWEEGHNTYISQIYDYEKERYQLPELIKGPILMELWTYDLGSNKFIRYLHFANGRLIRIETGEKGSN
ncbi:MAG: DUF2845 domain-containing protein [Desulfobacterales bacterium]|jgi:hypothetical protein